MVFIPIYRLLQPQLLREILYLCQIVTDLTEYKIR